MLGVAAEQPDPSMPDVPTMKSLGFDVVAASAAGILAPAGTPKPVVDKLTRAMKAVTENADHQAKMKELGIGLYFGTPKATRSTGSTPRAGCARCCRSCASSGPSLSSGHQTGLLSGRARASCSRRVAPTS